MSFRPKSPAVPPSGEVTEGAAPAIAAPISGDELAARLFAEQGYLTFASKRNIKVGEITYEGTSVLTSLISAPLRVVAVSSREEHTKQVNRMREILGLGPW